MAAKSVVDLIYCADGNCRFYEMAKRVGFKYGAQLPGTIHGPLFFADQDWKKPNREAYMAALAKHRPHVATILDWEREEQLPEVLSWAEEAAQFIDVAVIVPKVIGTITKLPRKVGGAEVRLGYSIPTKFGGTFVPVWEFNGWPIHLLGGSPHRQMELCHYFDVHSADGNMINKMATQHCQFWTSGNARYANNRWWPTLREANDGENWSGDDDAPYEAFRRSCENIARAWKRLLR